MSDDDREGRRVAAGDAVAKYARRRTSVESANDDQPEDFGPFLKREREANLPALSFDLVLKNGNEVTIEYGHRTHMTYDPEIGIEMYFSTGMKITIRGKHLKALYKDLARHKIIEVSSVDELHAFGEYKSDVTGKDLPVVFDIILEQGGINAETGLWEVNRAGGWNSESQRWEIKHTLN